MGYNGRGQLAQVRPASLSCPRDAGRARRHEQHNDLLAEETLASWCGAQIERLRNGDNQSGQLVSRQSIDSAFPFESALRLRCRLGSHR